MGKIFIFSTKCSEQLSSSSGWRFMAKKVPATTVAGAGVEGL